MKKGLTELVFILDKSGSMHGLEADTIGGFNSFIEKQKDVDGECLVSTVLFSDRSQVLHDRARLETIAELTKNDYRVGGCTALFDAIGDAVHHIETVHRYIRDEDVPESTVFVIITDGMENASRRWKSAEVKRLIESKREKNKWEFLFLGANIDSAETAESIGIARNRAVDYECDAAGTQANFDAIDFAVSSVRCCQSVDPGWAERVKAPTRRKKA